MKNDMHSYFLCLMFLFPVFFFAQNTVAEEPALLNKKPPQKKSFEQVTVRNFFSCEVPADWYKDTTYFGLTQEEKKVYGFSLSGHYAGDISTRISVYYYAEGNLLYKSMDRYISTFSQPVALEGSKYDQITTLTVSGREAKIFERTKNEYVPVNNIIKPSDKPAKNDPRIYEKREMMARPVPVRERFIVISAESGFYALRYTAQVDRYKEFLPVFERVAASFKAMQ